MGGRTFRVAMELTMDANLSEVDAEKVIRFRMGDSTRAETPQLAELDSRVRRLSIGPAFVGKENPVFTAMP